MKFFLKTNILTVAAVLTITLFGILLFNTKRADAGCCYNTGDFKFCLPAGSASECDTGYEYSTLDCSNTSMDDKCKSPTGGDQTPTSDQAPTGDYGLGKVIDKISKENPLLTTGGDVSPNFIATMLGRLIQPLVVLVGVVLLLIVVFAGVMWMTAGGNQEKVAKAKALIINGILGLLIVGCSYTIVAFVLNRLTSLVS